MHLAPVNGVAPEPATNATFTAELGRALQRPALLPVPATILRAALGEMSAMLLASQRVEPGEILARNVDAQTFAALRPRLARIDALYRDVKPGDRYSLTYVPGVGTELALNGQRLGVIDGADFSAAYFRIWLGDHPIDAQLRDQLLGCARRDSEDKHAAAPRTEHGVP